ncbi:MAG TPA: hypothetical protein DCL15_04870 [Chloroflexi bacterium]|nr:hypothetical protein [Chloroflexota bacterium]HHW88212.1 class I SAM-dependent methyltransferase [Chloroflexota bacterium]
MTTSQFTSSPPRYPDLDYAFLRYIGVSVEGEAVGHGVYLPLLQGYRRIVDLGCGLGGFVKLLRDHGFDAYGVDADPQCVADAGALGIPIVESDVISHLRSLTPGSLDAVFSAHLVEHLPYEVVMELIELAFRALRPGGRLLLVTPNPRALVSHLELYTMHFGHVAMYHPNLLAFFMQYSGFVNVDFGENHMTSATNVAASSPLAKLDQLLPELSNFLARDLTGQVAHRPATQVIPKPSNWLRRLLWHFKMTCIKWLVQPYYDQLGEDLATHSQSTQALAEQVAMVQHSLHMVLTAVHRPFESYVVGNKPA